MAVSKSPKFCEISCHFGLHVIVMKNSGLPYFWNIAIESKKFYFNDLGLPLNDDGKIHFHIYSLYSP